MKISFLASHGGSSAKAIIAAIADSDIPAEPGLIITNNADSAIHQWCLQNNFPVSHISAATHGEQVDEAVLDALRDAGTDLVVCSGYMKKIGPLTLDHYQGRILNIHPSLLPRHGGQGLYGDRVHAAVLAAGDTQSGATVHVVSVEYDEGPIVGQSHVDVTTEDTVDSLRQKVQATEPDLYIQCVKSFLTSL